MYFDIRKIIARIEECKYPRTWGSTNNLGNLSNSSFRVASYTSMVDPIFFREKGNNMGYYKPHVLNIEIFASKTIEIMLKGNFVQNHAKLVLKDFMHIQGHVQVNDHNTT